MAAELVARLLLEPVRATAPETFRAFAVLENVGERAVVISLTALSSPSLALEILNARGERLLLPPPGVPAGVHSTEELATGGVREIELGGFLPSWTEPGEYRARLRYVAGAGSAVHSEWVEFVLDQ
jgi:hypothetical protein